MNLPAPPPSTPTAEVLDLLERAAFDLRESWHAAAYDCLARALRLLAVQLEVTSHD